MILKKRLKFILVLIKNALLNKEKARQLILNLIFLKIYIKKNKLISASYEYPRVTKFSNISLVNGNQNHPVPLLLLKRNIIYCKKNNFFDDTFNFIDIGSGSGFLMHYVLNKLDYFQSYQGIEFENFFFKIGEKNLINYRHKNLSLLYKDAKNFFLEDKKFLIYLYNPFKFAVLKNFLQNNYVNINKNKSIIIYHNDIHLKEIKNEFKFRYLEIFQGTSFILPKN